MLTRSGKYAACGLLALCCLALLVACSGGGIQAVGELVPLQRQLAAEYGASDIKVELEDGHTLGITLASASSGAHTRAQQEEQAWEIASFVCEHYGSMAWVDRVWVAFESRGDGFLPGSSSAVRFAFERGELACGDHP